MRKLFFLIVTLSLLSALSSAVPVRPHTINVTQPDGTTLRVKPMGDEWGAWLETLDGHTVVQNNVGEWVYAGLNGNQLLASYSSASAPAPPLLEQHLHSSIEKESPTGPWKGPNRDMNGKIAAVPQAAVVGNHKAIVLLVNFTDDPRVDAGSYTAGHYDNIFFNASNNASMYSFYNENSYGLYNLSGDIAGDKWYTSAHSMGYYGDNCGGIDNCYSSQTYDLICEALSLADDDVDFSQYDVDGDGYIDHIVVVHAGGDEAAYYPSNSNYLWSVRWNGNLCGSTTMFDGKLVNSGVVIAEDAEIGTPCHELGHDNGAVDLYDTSVSTWEGIGEWGLMGSGNWLGSPQGSNPSHFSAWHKYVFGWINPTIVTEPLYDEPIKAIESFDDAYLIPIPLGATVTSPNEGGTNEYFLVENRQKIGFDSSQNGDGLIIYHIDDGRYQSYKSNNRVNADESDKGIDVEEADEGTQIGSGLDDVRGSGGDRGSSADTWKDNNDGFTDASTPNSRAKNGTATYINVTNISASGATIYADFLQNGSPTIVVLLEGGNVSPQSGNESTVFNWSVSYRNVNNTAPSYINATIDGMQYNMAETDASDTTYSDGKTYSYAGNLSVGTHNYSFSASDGNNTNTTETQAGPVVHSTTGPTVLLLTPSDNYTLTISAAPLIYNVSGIYNISNCSLYTNSTGAFLLNETESDITVNSTNAFSKVLSDGIHVWNVECTDSLNYSNFAVANYTLNIDTAAPTTAVLINNTTYANTSGVNFTWGASTDFFGIAYYLLEVSTQSNFTANTTYNTTDTSQLTTNLTDATTYFARVKSVDNSGWSSGYGNTTNTTIDLTAPSAPVNPTSGVVNDDTPALSWTASNDSTSGIANYTITLTNTTRNISYASNTSAVTVNTTLYDGLYAYTVRATDNAGNSGNTTNSSFTVKTITINEVGPNAIPDWIELYNIGGKNQSLAGWRLATTTGNYTITGNITAEGHLLLNATATNLTLNASADTVMLYLPNGTLWDNVSFTSIAENNSYGRQRDGTGDFTTFNENQSTPGGANTQTIEFSLGNGWSLLSIPLVI